MMRRRSRSISTEKVYTPEEPSVSWRNNTGYFITLEANVEKAESRLQQYGQLVAGYRRRLEGADDSLSLDEVTRIATEFRQNTRDYTSTVHAALERLESAHIAIATALDAEDQQVEAAAASDEERYARQRMRLSAQLVARWMRAGHPQLAAELASRREELSSSYSEGNGIGREKMNRGAACRALQEKVDSVSKLESRECETELDAGEPLGGVTQDVAAPQPSASDSSGGLADVSRGDPDGHTSSSGGGGGGAATPSGGDGAEGSGQPAAAEGAEDPEASLDKSGVTQYSSAASASFLSFHSATSGAEADCEAETTTTAATATTTATTEVGKGNGGGGSSDGSGTVKGNGGNGNGRVSVQSTASQTEDSWIHWDCVELGEFDKCSPWSVLHELWRQHGLVRAALLRHADRLSQVSAARLQLLAPAHRRRVSRLLRAQLQDALRAVASEVREARHALRMRAATLRLFSAAVWNGPPLVPPPAQTIPQQLLAAATARRPPLGAAVRRAIAFLFCIPSRQSSWAGSGSSA